MAVLVLVHVLIHVHFPVEHSFQLGVDKFFPPPKVITKKGEVAKQEIAMLREVNQFQLLE